MVETSYVKVLLTMKGGMSFEGQGTTIKKARKAAYSRAKLILKKQNKVVPPIGEFEEISQTISRGARPRKMS